MHFSEITVPVNELSALAYDASERAGAFLMSRFRNTNESIGMARRAVEQMIEVKTEEIIQFCLNDKTEYGFIGKYSSNNSDKKYVWFIDALNGAMNYYRGIPHFATSIALLESGIPILGIVRDHCMNVTISAFRDRGAWLNNIRLVISNRNLLSSSVTAVEMGEMNQRADCFTSICDKVQKMSEVRITGSTSLDLCHLASGGFDIFCAGNVKVFGIAAGLLIAKEAGAVFSITRNQGSALNILAVAHKLEQQLATSLPELVIFSDDLPRFAV